jgi:hypothetical protein
MRGVGRACLTWWFGFADFSAQLMPAGLAGISRASPRASSDQLRMVPPNLNLCADTYKPAIDAAENAKHGVPASQAGCRVITM